jgi:hypothetical protein
MIIFFVEEVDPRRHEEVDPQNQNEALHFLPLKLLLICT